ncbi:MAG: DUF4279 domain-containing protein [Verrucomicrobiota bacterium]|jgi:hypothetical protein
MCEFPYSVSFCVVHPSIAPEEITRALGMKLDSQSEAGKERLSFRGKPSGRKAVLSYWQCKLRHAQRVSSEDVTLDDFLKHRLAELEKNRSFLAQIISDGGKVFCDIGWDARSPCTTGVFDHGTLAACGRLGIHLEINVTVPEAWGRRNRGRAASPS